MEIRINNGFDVCIRLKQIPDKDNVYTSQMMGSSDEDIVEEEKSSYVKTIYYFEHRSQNLKKKQLKDMDNKLPLPKSMRIKLQKNVKRAQLSE